MAAVAIPPGCAVYQRQVEETCLDRIKLFAEMMTNKSDVGSILNELRSYKNTVGQEYNSNLSHQFRLSILNILTDLKENNSYDEAFNDVFGINKVFLTLFIIASIIVSFMAFILFSYGLWGAFGHCCKKFSDYRKLTKQKKYDYKQWEIENLKKRPSFSKDGYQSVLGDNISVKSKRSEKTKNKGAYDENSFLREKLTESDNQCAQLQDEVKQLKAGFAPIPLSESVDV